MKLEKREITLNEMDSLYDALYLEKTLLIEYANALFDVRCRQTIESILSHIKEVSNDLYMIKYLINSITEQE